MKEGKKVEIMSNREWPNWGEIKIKSQNSIIKTKNKEKTDF